MDVGGIDGTATCYVPVILLIPPWEKCCGHFVVVH